MEYLIINSEIFSLLILPVLIFMARVMDVTLGTIRIIFVTRGKKFLATMLGFFEVMVWILAIGQIMQNLTNITYYLAYAGGFAMGNYVGIYIEEKLAIGTLAVRIITIKDASELADYLKSKKFGVTSIDAHGNTGNVKVIITIIKRKHLAEVVSIIKRFNPRAFYSVEDIKAVSEGAFPEVKSSYDMNFLNSIKYKKK
ncbi:MAG: DUF2179 domain-containing protein [Methanosarcinaceae archaeon]|nr:DUF2179 domain-containing protein [Methanosarcinaceae archaeon]